MAKAHGKKAVLKIRDSGGNLTDVSNYLTSAGLPRDVDLAESSGLAQDDKTFVVGLRGATLPLEGSFDPTIDELLEGLLGLEAGSTFEYYPQGTTRDLPRYDGAILMSSYESTSDLGAAGRISASFTVNGAVTRGRAA